MSKVNEFLKNWGMMILTPLVIIMFFKTCTINRVVSDLETKTKKVDSLYIVVSNLPATIQENDDQQTAKFLYWEKQADKPEYNSYTIKDYYESIKK